MLKFDEEKITIEFPSDFKITIRERLDADGRQIPLVPLLYIFRDCNNNQYLVSHDGTKGINCVKYDDRVELIFENYNLFGHIKYTEYLSFEDVDFPDGLLNTQSTFKSPIFIHNCGCNKNNISIIDAICRINYVIKSIYSAGDNIEISDDFVISAIVPKKISELENDSGYVLKADIIKALNEKVDKEKGKGLSSNDFTDEYKNRLDNLEGGLGNLEGKYALLNGDINQHFGASFLRLKIQKKDTKINVPEGVGFYFTEDGVGSEVPSGGGGGVSSYVDLTDKPQINNIELNGNKSATDLRIASLGIDGKVLSSQLPDYLLGQLLYGGDINASSVATLSATFKDRYGITSNTLTITSALASTYNNVYFICSANGTSGIVKTLNCAVGDWVISNGISWNKIDNTDAVSSVAGLVGTISASDLTNALANEIKKVKVNNAVNADKLGGQLPAYYAKASDLNKYLPLAGGEMTGSITALVSSKFRGIMYKNDTEIGGWVRSIVGVYNIENAILGEIGVYGSGQTLNIFYIGTKYSGTDAWLAVGEDLFTYKTNPIYHAGNSNKLDVAWTSKYLQLPILTTAPAVTEGVAFYYSNAGQGSETPTGGGGVSSYVDLTDKPKINGIELKSGNNTLAELSIASLVHTHAIADVTSLQTALDSKVKQVKIGTTAYNPASGIVTLPAYPTSLPASDVADWAKQPNKPTYTTTEVVEGTNKYFTEARSKAVKVNNAVNADKLNSKDANYYLTNNLTFQDIAPINGFFDATECLVNGGMITNYGGVSRWLNTPSEMNLGSVLMLKSTYNTYYNGISAQLAWDIYHNSETPTKNIWFRAQNNLGFANDWVKIWHSGNSNLLTVDWSAKKLKSQTLVIPTTAPTDLASGEIGLYWQV